MALSKCSHSLGDAWGSRDVVLALGDGLLPSHLLLLDPVEEEGVLLTLGGLPRWAARYPIARSSNQPDASLGGLDRNPDSESKGPSGSSSDLVIYQNID